VQSLARTFTSTAHAHAPVLYFDPVHGWTDLTLSQRGSQQGAPIAGAACCMTINPVLKHASLILGDRGAIVAVQDDIFVIGEEEAYRHALTYLTGPDGLPKVGCPVNMNKSITVVPHTAADYTGTEGDFTNIPAGERPRPKNPAKPDGAQIGRLWCNETHSYVHGLTFAGCPIGSDKYIHLWLKEATDSICSDIEHKVTLLSSTSVATLHAAVTYSLSTRFDWIMQTNMPSLVLPHALRIDEALLKAFASVSIELPTHEHDDDDAFTLDRIQLRISDGGAGLRLPSSILDHAYLNTLNMVMPMLIGGSGWHLQALAPELVTHLGAGSFDDANRGQRWTAFLASGSPYATEFELAHQRLHDRDEALLASLVQGGEDLAVVSRLRLSSPMLVDVEQFGSYANLDPVLPPGAGKKEKPGKVSRHWWSSVTRRQLDQRTKRMPTDDFRRVAWYGWGSSSSQIFQMPSLDVVMSNDEHRECVCTVLGLPSPAAAPILGAAIPSNQTQFQHTVDRYGWSLTNSGGWTGDDRRRQAHDELENVMDNALKSAGVRTWTKGNTKARLARGLPAGQGLDHYTSEPFNGNVLKGIMPDIILGLGDDDVIGDATGPGDLWTDTKTVGNKRTYVRAGDSRGHAVRTRQGEVHTEYVNERAVRGDRTFYRNNPLQPFKHMLEGLPRVRGLVFGMFSEFSKDVIELLKFVATKTAETWAAVNHLPAEEALQSCTWDLKRRWSLTALRANARVRIDAAHHVRYGHALVGSALSSAPAAAPTVSRTHCSWSTARRAHRRS
jgi:hypothetical protein